MRDKINKLLGRKSNYYDDEIKQMTQEEELKFLRKENSKLKKKACEQGIQKFKTRRSIRKFSEKPVDFKLICDVGEAGMNAPCAGNVQNYKIIIVENSKKRIECGKIAIQQYWLSQAPYLLVVVRDDSELSALYPMRGELYSIQNVAAVIENVLMAAHFQDLGACWVEAGDNEVLKESLGVPMDKKIDAIIPIGYPLENPQVPKLETMEMLFYEKWGERHR
jgi:nitroreductase